MTQGVVFWNAAFRYRGHTTDAMDDADLRDLDPIAWRCEISVTFQDYSHCEMTAGKHISLGDIQQAADVDGIAGQRLNCDTWAPTMISTTRLILSCESSGLL